MNLRQFIITLIVVAALPLGAQAPTLAGEARIHPPATKYAYPEGQTFVYKGEWRIWTAGTATLRLQRAGEQMKVLASADDVGIVARLFPVHDGFESIFNPKTFCSVQLTKHTEEGFRKRETVIKFDPLKKKSLLEETNLKTNEKKHQENDIPGCVTDVIAGMFYGASLPLHNNDVYYFPLNDGGRTSNVKLTVEGRETIKTDAGTFNTVRVSPEADATLMRKGKVWLWYTDDDKHTLVQMKGKLFWGTLVLSLKKIEGAAGK